MSPLCSSSYCVCACYVMFLITSLFFIETIESFRQLTAYKGVRSGWTTSGVICIRASGEPTLWTACPPVVYVDTSVCATNMGRSPLQCQHRSTGSKLTVGSVAESKSTTSNLCLQFASYFPFKSFSR